MEATREVWTIASQEFRRTTRTARIGVFLMLYLLFTSIVVVGVYVANRAIDLRIDQLVAGGADRAEIDKAIREERERQMMDRFGDKELVDAIKDVPLSVISIFSILLFWLPIYIMLLGFDQVSGELGNRSIRYITVRSRRGSILVGKFAGQALLLLSLLGLVHILLFIYSQLTFEDFPVAVAAITIARIFLASVIFSLAWLSLSTLCSTLFRTPVVSLVGNFIMVLVFLFIHFASWLASGGESQWRRTITALHYLTPTWYFTDLLHPLPSHYGVSILAYTAFAIVFLSVAWVVLRARDL